MRADKQAKTQKSNEQKGNKQTRNQETKQRSKQVNTNKQAQSYFVLSTKLMT